jgi:hypothetical protein
MLTTMLKMEKCLRECSLFCIILSIDILFHEVFASSMLFREYPKMDRAQFLFCLAAMFNSMSLQENIKFYILKAK